MYPFDENLRIFLTSCRENALKNLREENENHLESSKIQKDLLSKLESLISPEANKLLTAYMEKTNEILGKEADAVLLCGLSLSAEMHKRFDTSSPEYKIFTDEYL